jgi:dephospho-CoA kinase
LQRGEQVVVLDAPLLIETGFHRFMNFVVVVSVPEEVQLARLMRRDGIEEEEARRKMDSQMPLARKAKLADFVIDNSASIEETSEQVRQLVAAIGRRRTMLTRLNAFLFLAALSVGLFLLLRHFSF